MGQATLDFYDEREDELITDAERDYLNRLIDRKTTEAQEEDEQFYRDHRTELKEKPSLKKQNGITLFTDLLLRLMISLLELLFAWKLYLIRIYKILNKTTSSM